MILGIDEVGRGPWAGPLVVGAVVLPEEGIDGLNDSKKLSAKRREILEVVIKEKALGWGLGWVHAEEIDKVGLSAALKLATIRAVEQVTTPYHEIILDGTVNFLKDTEKGKYVTTMAKADFLIPAVSAASIIAKVARDRYMAEQDSIHEGYNFASHVGYGTAAHQLALATYGVSPLHRRSFAPIKKMLTHGGEPANLSKPSTTATGKAAEAKVATFLVGAGHTILERNWKTRHCEIDIISLKNNELYFTEVKYRSSSKQGGGLEAVTPLKQKQMAFAAEVYQSRTKQPLLPHLAVAGINGQYDIEFIILNEL